MKIGFEYFGFGSNCKSGRLLRYQATMSKNSSQTSKQNNETKGGRSVFDNSLGKIPIYDFDSLRLSSSVLNHSFKCEVKMKEYEKASLDGYQTRKKETETSIQINTMEEGIDKLNFIVDFE